MKWEPGWNATITWDAENVAKLSCLHANGLSASQIGAELGCSRNAVIGKAHRLGLPKPLAPPKPKTIAEKQAHWAAKRSLSEHRSRVERLIKRRDEVVHSEPEHQPLDRKPGHRTFFDLGVGECKWPLGADMDPVVLFCGAAAVSGKPYCGEHCRMGGSKYAR